MIPHLVRRKNVVDQHQPADYIPNRHSAMAIDNAGVRDALGVQAQKIVVLSEDGAARSAASARWLRSLSPAKRASCTVRTSIRADADQA